MQFNGAGVKNLFAEVYTGEVTPKLILFIYHHHSMGIESEVFR
jgi:hypothetical protein